MFGLFKQKQPKFSSSVVKKVTDPTKINIGKAKVIFYFIDGTEKEVELFGSFNSPFDSSENVIYSLGNRPFHYFKYTEDSLELRYSFQIQKIVIRSTEEHFVSPL